MAEHAAPRRAAAQLHPRQAGGAHAPVARHALLERRSQVQAQIGHAIMLNRRPQAATPQKQGRTTLQLKGMPINDDAGLEREADLRGDEAIRAGHGAAANGAAPVPLPAMSAQRKVIQAKIVFRDKSAWTRESDIPQGTSVGHAQHVLSPDTYLAQTPQDVANRSAGRKAPLLTPHRHLIGEHHNESQFLTAKKDWGWGAATMAEGLTSSHTVPDLHSAALVKDKGGDNEGDLPLENLHAGILSDLAQLRMILTEMKNWVKYSSQIAEKAKETDFRKNEASVEDFRTAARKQWDNISLFIPSYKDAVTKAHAKKNVDSPLKAINIKMVGNWTHAVNTATEFLDKPYGALTSWETTKTRLSKIPAKIDEFFEYVLDPWASQLVTLTVLEAGRIGHRDEGGIKAAWDTGSVNKKGMLAGKDGGLTAGLVALSPVREIFMAHNVSNLAVPGLVLIGEAHVDPVAAKVDAAKPYKNYALFSTALNTITEQADPWVPKPLAPVVSVQPTPPQQPSTQSSAPVDVTKKDSALE